MDQRASLKSVLITFLLKVPVPLLAVLVSVITSLYLIFDYGVVNDVVVQMSFAKSFDDTGDASYLLKLPEATQHFYWFINLLSTTTSLSLASVAYIVMIICHAMIAYLLTLIVLELDLSKTTCFCFLFLLLSHPNYNNFRSIILPEVIYWVVWLAALLILIRYHKKHVVVTILAWVGLFLIGFLFNLGAWLWLAFFPLGLLFWRQFRTKPVVYALLGYFLLILVLSSLPIGGQSLAMSLVVSIREHIIDLQAQITEENFFWANAGDSFSVWTYFLSGNLSLFLIKLILSLGFVNVALTYYAIKKKQIQLLESKKEFLIYVLMFDVITSIVVIVLQPQLQSVAFFSSVFILLILASLGLSRMLRKAETGRYQNVALLIAVWCAVAYIASGYINFGPSKHYIKEAGTSLAAKRLPELQEKIPVYSNNTLFLYYAGQDKRMQQNYQQVILLKREPFYFGYELNRKRSLPTILKDFPIAAEFKNSHQDRFIIFRINPNNR